MLLGYEYPIQMRKELLLCNTENRVNLFPFFWARLTFFSCFEVGSPNISVTHSFVLLYIGSSLCSSLLPVPTVPCLRSRGLQRCNRKTGDMICFCTHTNKFCSAKDLQQSEPEQSAASLANCARWEYPLNYPFRTDEGLQRCRVL